MLGNKLLSNCNRNLWNQILWSKGRLHVLSSPYAYTTHDSRNFYIKGYPHIQFCIPSNFIYLFIILVAVTSKFIKSNLVSIFLQAHPSETTSLFKSNVTQRRQWANPLSFSIESWGSYYTDHYIYIAKMLKWMKTSIFTFLCRNFLNTQ